MGRVWSVFVHVFLLFIFASVVSTQQDALEQFIKFIVKFKKPYRNGTDEYRRRFEIFKSNLQEIERLNKPYLEDGGPSVYGITAFSDMSQDEFRAQYLSDLRAPKHRPGKTSLLFRPESKPGSQNMSLPQLVDWRKVGAVSAIKDQKQCGACWAFSVAEIIESAYAIAHNTGAPSLAVQELIDCSKPNRGCEGGDICAALDWAKGHGITYEKYYPLLDKDGVCKKVPPGQEVVHVSNFECNGFMTQESGILSILANQGPVAAAVDASTWNNYVGGIIRFHCENSINHAVEIVGYDLTGPVPYYIVRNSWGTGFGMDGYLYIKIGKNLCGIAERVGSVTGVN